VAAWGRRRQPGVETKAYDKSMVNKAVKCDTSKGLPHGPACVSACPTGAALRVSPERLLDYTNPVEA
jgi:cGMP-dependent protein kinase 2